MIPSFSFNVIVVLLALLHALNHGLTVYLAPAYVVLIQRFLKRY
jgi:hypothetical protein